MAVIADCPSPGGKGGGYRTILPGGGVCCIPPLSWPNLSLFLCNLSLPCLQIPWMVVFVFVFLFFAIC